MLKHNEVASLDFSGETVIVGYLEDNDIYIQLHLMPEPTYMSIQEAKMLSSALEVCIEKALQNQ